MFLSDDRAAFWTAVRWRGPLLFQTTDEYPLAVLAAAAVRCLLLRRTAGTLHRPPNLAKGIRRKVLWRAFRLTAKAIPRFALFSIAPPIVSGAFVDVDGWIYDPEWWDLSEDELAGSSGRSQLCSELERRANGRPIILFTGMISQLKGFEFFAELAANWSDDFFFAAIGKNVDIPTESLEAFTRNGGHHHAEYVSDGDLFSCVSAARLLWCCYRPDYDQSSGIFGRALQLGVCPIVRMDSWLDAASQSLGVGVPVTYGDTRFLDAHLGRPASRRLAAEMRAHSVTQIAKSLGLPVVAPREADGRDARSTPSA